MSLNKITLSVIVPFFNEEQYLKQSVERLLEINFIEEIFLIDDNSKDNSLKIAKKLEEKYTKIKVIKNLHNTGKGGAVKLAQKYIQTSHTVIHDADLEYYPTDLVEMFEAANQKKNAMILGSRFIGNKNRTSKYKRTYLANKFISKIFSFVFKKNISDVATCYKMMPSVFFNSVNIRELGFTFEIELIAKFLKFNDSIVEVPINYSGRSYREGKKIKFKDGFLYIFGIIKFRYFF